MERYFVDSNIFLRYYSHDDKLQSEQAEGFFLRAKRGEIKIFCGPPVFFEVAWVLKTFYKLPNVTILDTLESMLSIPNFTVFDSEHVIKAIELARKKSCGFADSFGYSVTTFRGGWNRKSQRRGGWGCPSEPSTTGVRR